MKDLVTHELTSKAEVVRVAQDLKLPLGEIQSKLRCLKVFPGQSLMEKHIIKNQFRLWSF